MADEASFVRKQIPERANGVLAPATPTAIRLGCTCPKRSPTGSKPNNGQWININCPFHCMEGEKEGNLND